LIIVILIMTLVRFRQRALIESEKLKTNQRELAFQKDRSDWMEREKSFRDQLINQQKIVLTQAIADKEEMDLRLKELVKEKQEERRKELLEQLEKSKDKKLNIEILLAEFNAIQPTFTSQLLKKYPELSGADIQFCTLIRMNLTTKEISVLLNIEPQSIYKKKYRAIEKMGLSEVEDFEKVLFGIG
jgi:DNA-binding CsgD family transcriptional regulator